MSKKYHILSKAQREAFAKKRSKYMVAYMAKYNKRRRENNSDLEGYVFTLDECNKYLENKPIIFRTNN